MKQLDRRYKVLLKDIASLVQKQLSHKIYDPTLIKIKNLQPYNTNSFGFMVEVYRFKRLPGRIELWLDLFPNVNRPIISLAYSNGDMERVKKIANSATNIFRNEPDLDYNVVKVLSGGFVLESPLQGKFFDKFIIESYYSSFFNQYFKDEIKVEDGISETLVRKIAKKAEWLIRATVSALESSSTLEQDYPAIENRIIVSEHKKRDRSPRLSEAVKFRDGFTCQVCDFNFNENYGEIGRGFAESHHTIALSNLKRLVETKKEDLITVCSNCHRMLHRMTGQANDYKLLRRNVQKIKSRQA